jgi:hypothetical protein
MSGFWTWPGAIVVTGVVVGLALGFLTGSVLLWLTIGAVLGVVVEATMTNRRRNAPRDDGDPKD